MVLEFVDQRHGCERPGWAWGTDVGFSQTRVWREFLLLRVCTDVSRRILRSGCLGRSVCTSGARYVALTSKHHEGFTLWRSVQANHSWGRAWNSVDIGPKRDLVLDLCEAGRRKGLEMGIYYSLYEWYNPLWLSNKQRFVSEHLFPQFKDIVTHVKPAIIFSDGEWELTSAEWRSPELLTWLYNESPVAEHVVVDDRWGKDTRHKHGGYYTTEYTSGMQQSQHPWEESRGMGYSYGYNRMESLKDYHTN